MELMFLFTLCSFKPMLFLCRSSCEHVISQGWCQPPTPCLLFFSFSDPLMKWNGWRKCQLCFRALGLSATRQNQNPKQKGVKIRGSKSNHGKWWWIRNTLSCGGALLQAPIFTSTEVSPVWLLSRCVPWLPTCAGLLFLVFSINCSVLVVSQEICRVLLFVVFPLLDDKCLSVFFAILCRRVSLPPQWDF